MRTASTWLTYSRARAPLAHGQDRPYGHEPAIAHGVRTDE